jgi:uncharacterized Zn-finger protein
MSISGILTQSSANLNSVSLNLTSHSQEQSLGETMNASNKKKNKPYECTECPSKFFLKHNLQQHINHKHKKMRSIHIKLQDTGFLFMKTTIFIVYF